MKRSLIRKLCFSVFIPIILHLSVGSILGSQAQNISKKAETEVFFPNHLSSSNIDFKLKSTGARKFKVILQGVNIRNNITVKIYDIVGNLIIEDHIKPGDGNEKDFDFSHINSQLFVVEVGNSKYNKTKSIYAQPHGIPKELIDAET